MKFKKQMRWLVFLLVPFMTLLTIHFLIPLEMVLNSSPILEQAYNTNRINLQQNNVRANTLSTKRYIQSIVNKYFAGLDQIVNFLSGSDFRAIEVNSSNVTLNNANQFAQQVKNKQINQSQSFGQSMWFSTNISQLQQLPPFLQRIVEQYKITEPFIKSTLITARMVASFSFYIQKQGQSIYFSYPTIYQEQYLELASPTLTDYFYITINNANNGSYKKIMPFVEHSQRHNQGQLILCQAFNMMDSKGVACIHLQLQHLNRQIIKTVGYNFGEYTSTTNFLLVSTHLNTQPQSINPTIILKFDTQFPQMYTNQISQFNMSGAKLDYHFFDSGILSLQNNIFVMRVDKKTYYISPLVLDHSDSSNIVLHLLSINNFKQSKLSDKDLTSNLNTLLIPIVLLIIIASLISAVVLKILLDSIDQEMFELENRCKFIVEGDINVEIPDYEGTKDIKQVYDMVKIINKLHRYSTSSYFTGHFASKILKYNQALHTLKYLDYDTGTILQNMGEAYTYLEQWDKSIQNLKDSVDIILKKIEISYGSLDQIVKMKITKKIPHHYKELQIILIRRLFKLNFSYMKYLELKPTFTKKDQNQNLDQKTYKKRIDDLTNQSSIYLTMQKKAFFPDFSGFSQSIMMLLYESKQLANLKKIDQAKDLIEKSSKILNIYAEQYADTTKRLKEKGSKNKFLHKKNKLTAHSRVHPQILIMFRNMLKSKIVMIESKSPSRYIQGLNLLFNGVKASVITLSVGYLIVYQIRRLLLQLKIDPIKFQSTQIFKQVIPFKTLFTGVITKQNQAQLLKFPTKVSTGLEREFVYLVDCAKQQNQDQQKWLQYQNQRSIYIFQKLIKKTDRLSIIKINTKEGIKIECNLILKESNQIILKKQIIQSFAEKGTSKVSKFNLIYAVQKAIWRIKKLQSQKIIILFFKSLRHYSKIIQKGRRKKKTKHSIQNQNILINDQIDEMDLFQNFGQQIVELIKNSNLKNLKLILNLANGDEMQQFILFFGLHDINRALWKANQGININNNIVYLISDKHKTDIDKILMLKTQDIPDNHVFIL